VPGRTISPTMAPLCAGSERGTPFLKQRPRAQGGKRSFFGELDLQDPQVKLKLGHRSKTNVHGCSFTGMKSAR